MDPQELEVRLFIALVGAPEEEHFGCRPIDATTPEAFVESSLAQTGPVCCTMQGVFAVSLGGVPCNGGLDQFVRDGPLVPYYDVNALATAIDGVRAVTRLVGGAERATAGPHEDEGPTHFFRTGPDEAYMQATGQEPEPRRMSLRELAGQMLRESRKLERLAQQALLRLEALASGEPPRERHRSPLLSRIDEIRSWQIERAVAELAQALGDRPAAG